MASTYTRQQLTAAVELPDALIAYWIKLGLLIPHNEGGGKGRHRRFGFEAVHIAAVLAELARYGVNTAALRKVADILWAVVEFGKTPSEAFSAGEASSGGSAISNASSSLARLLADSIRKGEAKWVSMPPSDEIENGILLVSKLHKELFSTVKLRHASMRWIFYLDGETLLIMPEELPFETFLGIFLESYITINISLVIPLAWERLSKF